MDRETLLLHEAHGGHEPVPVNAHLDRLTSDEAGLCTDLIEGTHGPALRLEQERIRFGAVRAAVTAVGSG